MVVDLVGLRCTEDFGNVDEAMAFVGCFVGAGNFGDDDKNDDCSSS